MTATVLPPPQPRLWTREEYHKAAELGLFHPTERLELLNGRILKKVSPQSHPHASAISISAETMRAAFGAGYHVREEKPIVLSDFSEPEPDVAVIRGGARALRKHPTPAEIVLLIEVSESTLTFDQGEKAAAYAESGIADYWLLNLRKRQLEVRRDPGLLANGEAGYQTLLIVPEEGEIAPLARPEITIRVADLLPAPLDAGSAQEDRNGVEGRHDCGEG